MLLRRLAALPCVCLALAGCQTAPGAVATQPSASPALPYGLPTTVVPWVPPSLNLATLATQTPPTPATGTEPALSDRLSIDMHDYATFAVFTNAVLAKLATATPAVGQIVDVSLDATHPLQAKVTTLADRALLQVSNDASFSGDHLVFSLTYDSLQHGYMVYKPNGDAGSPLMASSMRLDLGTASFDAIENVTLASGTVERLRRHQDFEAHGGQITTGFELKQSSLGVVTGQDPDILLLTATFLNFPQDPAQDGAIAALELREVKGDFVYIHGDGTAPSTDEHLNHDLFALPLAGGLFKPVSGAAVPAGLFGILPQESSIPHLPATPAPGNPFADPAAGLVEAGS